MYPSSLLLCSAFALCCLLSSAFAGQLDDERVLFQRFEQDFRADSPYVSDAEREYRFGVFRANLARIEQMNAAKNNRARFGVNKFADLTQEEFRSTYLSPVSANPNWEGTLPVAPLFSESEMQDLPSTVDWRKKGAVTPVKNQGACGSCWSFSTTGNVEGQWYLAGNKLVGLSEQNLVDCDHECMQYDGEKSCDAGCNGGLQPNAFRYIISNGGIDTESSYPYEGVNDQCRFKKADVGATIKNYTMVSKNETQMAAYCAKNGPLAIAADAVEWQFYIGGVFTAPCGHSLDHGILIVGYDHEVDVFGAKLNYWIVKNSWGADWGEDGYLYIEKGVGECGLNLFVSSSIV